MSSGVSQPEQRSRSADWQYGSGHLCIFCQMAASEILLSVSVSPWMWRTADRNKITIEEIPLTQQVMNGYLQHWRVGSGPSASSEWPQGTGSPPLAWPPACCAGGWGCRGRTGTGPGARRSSGWGLKRRTMRWAKRRGWCRPHLCEAAPAG